VRFGLLILLTGAAVLVWVFAIIGVTTVARATFTEPHLAPRVPLLGTDGQGEDVPGAEIAGLPRYPGAVRAEYRVGEWDGSSVTKAEYRTQDGTEDVLRHYRAMFKAGNWDLQHRSFEHGEHVFEVTLGHAAVTVQVERVGSVTEIEIERVQPSWMRGGTTGR
jgi:hypothetical protein